jgi:hypothetical protein
MPPCTIQWSRELCKVPLHFMQNLLIKTLYVLCKSCRGSADLQLCYLARGPLLFQNFEKNSVEKRQTKFQPHPPRLCTPERDAPRLAHAPPPQTRIVGLHRRRGPQDPHGKRRGFGWCAHRLSPHPARATCVPAAPPDHWYRRCTPPHVAAVPRAHAATSSSHWRARTTFQPAAYIKNRAPLLTRHRRPPSRRCLAFGRRRRAHSSAAPVTSHPPSPSFRTP